MKKEAKEAEIQNQINKKGEKIEVQKPNKNNENLNEKSVMELIEELCPEGVEYKKLEEIGYTLGGLKGKNKYDFKDGNTKYVTYLNVFKNSELNMSMLEKVKIGQNENQNYIKYGDVLLTISSENKEETGMSSVVTNSITENIALNSFCMIFRLNETYAQKINSLFLKHLFRSSYVRTQIIKCTNGVTRYNLSKTRLMIIEIPIPPLEVQEKIAEVLDSFSESTEDLQKNLTKELELRKKQYEYYRDDLLRFPEGSVEYKQIKEIAQRIKGTGITAGTMKKIADERGNIKIFAGGKTAVMAQLKDIPNANITERPSVIVQSRGIVNFIYYDKPFTFKNEMWAYTVDNTITLKYLYYVLKNNVEYFRELANKKGAMPQIATPDTDNFKIPVPSIEKQKQIVEILEPFEKLTQSLTEGIPAEIEGRKKQYEYYRDLLLNFKRKED